jgi:glycosyltransferase involved in cell wall biosynthesis
MRDRAADGKPRICMLLRTSVLRNPRVTKQARSLVEAGWDVQVVSMGVAGEDRRVEEHPAGFTILRTRPGLRARWRQRATEKRDRAAKQGGAPSSPATPPYNPGRLRVVLLLFSRFLVMLRMLPLVRRSRPDVVLAHNVGTLLTGWLACRLTGARLAYDAHEVNLDREGYYQKLKLPIRLVEGCLLPRCDLAITTTAMRARHFRRVYRLERTPAVFENRPHVAAAAGIASLNDSGQLREMLGLAADQVIALYQGGLQEGRGLHNMVRALARVEGLDLVFLGDGPQAATLRSLAEELGVAGRVHMPGNIALDELLQWTASADMGLQLLRNTSFNHYSTDSNKIFEYGVAGIPVIASDFPEIRRIVRRHDYGLLVDPHDVSAIAGAMQRLVDDKALRLRLRDNARQASPDLSWQAVEYEYVASIRALLPDL